MKREREILKNIFGYNEFRPTTDIDNTPNILRSIFPANISLTYNEHSYIYAAVCDQKNTKII